MQLKNTSGEGEKNASKGLGPQQLPHEQKILSSMSVTAKIKCLLCMVYVPSHFNEITLEVLLLSLSYQWRETWEVTKFAKEHPIWNGTNDAKNYLKANFTHLTLIYTASPTTIVFYFSFILNIGWLFIDLFLHLTS